MESILLFQDGDDFVKLYLEDEKNYKDDLKLNINYYIFRVEIRTYIYKSTLVLKFLKSDLEEFLKGLEVFYDKLQGFVGLFNFQINDRTDFNLIISNKGHTGLINFRLEVERDLILASDRHGDNKDLIKLERILDQSYLLPIIKALKNFLLSN